MEPGDGAQGLMVARQFPVAVLPSSHTALWWSFPDIVLSASRMALDVTGSSVTGLHRFTKCPLPSYGPPVSSVMTSVSPLSWPSDCRGCFLQSGDGCGAVTISSLFPCYLFWLEFSTFVAPAAGSSPKMGFQWEQLLFIKKIKCLF